MRPLAALARPLLAGIFVVSGADLARKPGPRTQVAEKLGVPQPALMVRLNGAAMVAGGSALAIGYKPRLSALLLLGTLAPTTYAAHPFWEQTEAPARQQQQIHFLKNAGLAGGLLYALADSPRVRSARRDLRRERRAVRRAEKAAARAQRGREQ